MPREQKPVRPIVVYYKCDHCREGYMMPTGVLLTSDPPQFPHKCSVCGHTQTFTEKYPALRYAEEGGLLDLTNYQQEKW